MLLANVEDGGPFGPPDRQKGPEFEGTEMGRSVLIIRRARVVQSRSSAIKVGAGRAGNKWDGRAD